MDDEEGWISPGQAERMVKLAIPELSGRNVLARWIENEQIELRFTGATQWVDDPANYDHEALREYRDAHAIWLKRQVEFPRAARLKPTPEPQFPIPPIKRESLEGAQLPLEDFVGVNYLCGELWELAELTLEVRGQQNSDSRIIYAGIRLSKADVERLLNLSGTQLLERNAPERRRCDDIRGILPTHASQSAKDHEEAAHAAAEIVRRKKCSVAEAIRQLGPVTPARNREPASVDRAVRDAYNLMYDLHGGIKL